MDEESLEEFIDRQVERLQRLEREIGDVQALVHTRLSDECGGWCWLRDFSAQELACHKKGFLLDAARYKKDG